MLSNETYSELKRWININKKHQDGNLAFNVKDSGYDVFVVGSVFGNSLAVGVLSDNCHESIMYRGELNIHAIYPVLEKCFGIVSFMEPQLGH